MSKGPRGIALAAFACFLLFAVFLLGAGGAYLVRRLAGESSTNPMTTHELVAAMTCALVGTVSCLSTILRIVRYAMWLDGTVVVERGAITTHRVDLATAELTENRGTVPVQRDDPPREGSGPAVIYARDPRTGRTISISVNDSPADELTAIANAIMARRRPGDPGYEQAEALARKLREMAAGRLPT